MTCSFLIKAWFGVKIYYQRAKNLTIKEEKIPYINVITLN